MKKFYTLLIAITVTFLFAPVSQVMGQISENFQSWTSQGAYGNYTQSGSGGTWTMANCIVAPTGAANGTGSTGYVQQKAGTGILTLPNVSSGGIGILTIQARVSGSNGTFVIEKNVNGAGWNTVQSTTTSSTTAIQFQYTINDGSANIQLRINDTGSRALYVYDVSTTTYSSCTAPTISFASSSVTKYVGDAAFTNTFSTNSSGTVTYSSSNTSVATINSSTGQVTVVGAGSTTITADQAADATYCASSASYSLTVNCIAPTLSFASSSITKNTGDASFTNTFSSNSGGTVTYSSSNTSVATINSSSGLVTIVGGGTTTITANQAASGNYCSGTTTYTLNVRSVTASPSSLSFSSNVGVTSAAQTVTVTGTNLSITPTYSISGTDASMFSASGTLTTSGGTISVTFTPTSTGSKSATLTIYGESGAITATVTLSGTVRVSADIVISQVYGAGGNTGATYKNDYVELFNRSASAVSLSGMYIQYASAAGLFSSNTPQALPSVSLQPGQYYLIQEGSGGSVGATLPTVDATGTINMSATDGKVALTSSSAYPTSSTDANVLDFVGFGSGNLYEGSAAAPAPSATTAIYRASGGCTDTDQNSADFSTATPSPRNTSSTYNVCSTGPTVTISKTSISNLDYNINNGPSSAQTFTVSGSSLTDDITVTPPADFEISTDGATFNGAITLTQSGGTVSATTIYVRLIEEQPLGSYTGDITLTSTGAATKTVSLSGAVVLDAPIATSATSVTSSGFTANWNTVTGATGYLVNVYTKSGGAVTDLFFSEYVEGSSNNKYLEIFNGTGSSVDLSNYQILLFANGATTATSTLNLSGTLTNGSTYTIGNASGTIYTPDLVSSGVTSYNGDDALGLFKISTSSYVDIFGNIGEDPGTAWTSDAYTTVDKTLVRKSSVTGGVTTNPSSGFPTLSTEWNMYNQDVVSYLGSHTVDASGKVPVTGSPFTISSGTTNSLVIYGLDASTQYYYTVVALYGSDESAESNEIAVTTTSAGGTTPTLSVAEATVPTMSAVIGYSDYETIHVSGVNLTGNISLSISGTNADYFTVSPTSIIPSSGSVTDYEVTIQYEASVTGSHTATLTIASAGATSIVLTLNGTTTADNKITVGSLNEDGTWNMSFSTSGNLNIYRATALNYADGVFFSKYLEAEGTNKLLEIFNGTLYDVDLTDWKIQIRQIGPAGGVHDWTDGTVYTYPLSGTLTKGTSKVFYTQDAATTCADAFDPSWINCTDPVLQFNGNDAIRLVNASGTVVDLFGQTSGTFPITNSSDTGGWETTGLAENFNTMRKLLLRKTSVTSGANAVSSNTTAFNTLETEWELYPTDYTADVISCSVLQEFGSYDYNANYSQWSLLSGVVDANNKKVDVSGVTSPTPIANCELLKAQTIDNGTATATDFFRKPIFVTSTNSVSGVVGSLTDDVCEECDIAVTNNSQLNATTEDKKFHNATVFSGSKLSATSTSKLEVNDLILKAGYSGNVYNSFPTSTMKIDASNGLKINGKLKYARTIDNLQWYFISFPYDVKINDITTLNPDLGTYNTDWFIKYWDGQSRADDRTTTGNWKRYISGDAVYDANSGYLKSYKGYIIGLLNGTKEIFFPLFTNSIIDADESKTIPVTAFHNTVDYNADPSGYVFNPDHDGWNLIGLPYFSKFEGDGATGISYYLLSDGGSSKTYTFFDPSDLTGSSALNPFISYYVQAGTTGDISFDFNSRSLVRAQNKEAINRDKVRIYYQSTTGTDYMNLVLDNNENTNYKAGSDLVKWFGTGTPKPQVYMTQGGYNLAVDAVDYANAVNIPVTVYNKTAGTVTFRADATNAANLASLVLTDKVTSTTTDLLTSNYTYTAAAGTISNRFVLNAQRIATGTNITSDEDGVRIISGNGKLRVENIATGSNVKLFDTVGRLVKNEISDNNILELTNLSKGIYVVQITVNGKVNNHKVVL